MADVQAMLWSGAAALVTVAVFAGWREHRRARRDDVDAVGMIAWPTVQILALIALAVLGLFALHQ
ncbi:hypothetical protein M0208_04325 [Sphingomonas sp. SUN019]|uniref:hypothetical protein n=1 Tax=Sphingomonas sp. SUN019 TaxID=2937788 RepID=UPI0021643015|nr:hypothetical protein [Sphingomonas sp. SUN019]UVO49778.1 hypothetical protein M0208_04325 [Sphingomonas sp. SUN019]